MAEPQGSGRKKRQVEAEGIAHIKATFSNTIVTIADMNGDTVAWSSSGKSGFKGSKKSTPFAATIAAELNRPHIPDNYYVKHNCFLHIYMSNLHHAFEN